MTPTKFSLLLVASLATALGCGPDDQGFDDPPNECPAERPVFCGEGNCIADTDTCPNDENPEAIEGQILSLSPGTLRGDASEQVKLSLEVRDSAAVKRILERGGSFTIVLRDSTGEEEISPDAMVEPDGEAKGIFELSFTPGEEERRSIRKEVQVRLSTDNGEGEVYTWGEGNFIAFPDDVDDLEFEGREARALEGIGELQGAWARDLDGDGQRDLVALDGAAEARRLVVFRCDDETCTNEGEVALAVDGDIGDPYEELFEVPDLAANPDGEGDEDQGAPFVIAYPSLRDADGRLREAEHLVVRLAEGDEDMELVEERTSITLPIRDGESWLANTMKARLILDPVSGEQRPGISILARQESSGEVFLNHVLLQQAAEPLSQMLVMSIEGLDPAGTQAVLHGHIASCPVDSVNQIGAELPDGKFVSVFEVGDEVMAVIGSSTAGDQMLQATVLDLPSVQGSVVCRMFDVDADGAPDVVFSVETDEGHALLVSLASENELQPSLGSPQLMMKGLSDAAWSVYRDEGELRLVMNRELGNPPTGEQPEITHEIGLATYVDPEGDLNLTVLHETPAVPGTHVHTGDRSVLSSILKTRAGHDLVRLEKAGPIEFATGIRSSDVGGLFLGSQQLRSSGGMWVGAHFSGGIVVEDESSLLKVNDPQSIIGWLSSTGPFLPVTSISCCSATTPIIIQDLAVGPGDDEDSDNDGVEAEVVNLQVDEHGDATGLHLESLARIDGEPRLAGEREIALDFSPAELRSQKVVKFKTGAELSKAVNAAAPDIGDCDDEGSEVRPGVCDSPSSTTLLLEMESGELASVVIDGSSDSATVVKVETAHEELEGELFYGSLGEAPVLASRGGPIGVDVWEVATELSQGQGEDRQTLTRDEGRIFFGDFQGLGHPQILEARLSEDEQGDVCGRTNHFSIAGGLGQGDLESIEAALDREGQSVCIPVEEAIAIRDIDGDRCEDLVFPESRQALLSRCDGSFETELAELGDWSAHVDGGDGWTGRAKDYNSSRSNKPRSIADLGGDQDDDGDGFDDEVIVVVPFVDGLQRR